MVHTGEKNGTAAREAHMGGDALDGTWGQGCGENCFTLDGDGFTCSRVLDEPEVWRVELLMHDTFLPSVTGSLSFCPHCFTNS